MVEPASRADAGPPFDERAVLEPAGPTFKLGGCVTVRLLLGGWLLGGGDWASARCVRHPAQSAGVVCQEAEDPSTRRVVPGKEDADGQPGVDEHGDELQDIDV